MAPLSNYIETAIGRLTFSLRGHDSLLLTRSTKIAALPKVIQVSSSECPSPSDGGPSAMLVAHTQVGDNRFPELEWKFTDTGSEEASKVRSWVVVVEDADAPLPTPIVHGIYYGIPASKMTLGPADFAVKEGTKWALSGGFYYGLNRRQTVYSGPRPIMGHGVHRYFYQVIGVGEGFEAEKAVGLETGVGKEYILKELDETAICWGEWVGSFERVKGITQ